MKGELEGLKKAKNDLCGLRLQLAKTKQTPEWTMAQLEIVLKSLKLNKSKDPHGYAHELFKEAAGDDLKKAILMLMNRIKKEQTFPKALEICNISSIWKKKKSRNNFENYRGIFRVSILRSILEKLIYNDEYQNIDINLSDSNVGARKGRNIRDNLFVVNAIVNSVIKGKEEAVDIQLFDVEKCFDSLWVEECINDMYEAGLNNEKLAILYQENQNAACAVKVNNVVSKRFDIKNIVMQGTVFGSLMCTTTMDKLGKISYQNEDLLYKYREVVDVPILGMVDDLMSIQKCSKADKANAHVNSFIESKKLKFSEAKCARIHIGKRQRPCKSLKVHDGKMVSAENGKYLGDYVSSSGCVKQTVAERVSKGYGIVSEIKAIIEEIPLGKYKVDIGLKLRQSLLLNGLLFNSEVWHSITLQEIYQLEKIDNILLRYLLGCPAKTAIEFLYLETGSVPIRYVIAARRLNFLHTVISRDKDEVTRRILEYQFENPLAGDFSELVRKDLEMIEFPPNLEKVRKYDQISFKKLVKDRIRSKAFKYLKERQNSHSKISNIKYEDLQAQSYLSSPLFTNNESKLISLLRSRMHPAFKGNSTFR